MALTRLVNRRLRSNYYQDRLILLATQEKSSSTLHEVAINEMLWHSGGVQVLVPTPRQQMAGPVQMGGGATFHFSMLLFFPNGGTCRGVFEPRHPNYRLAEEIGCRWVVLTRHPADRVVAQYCMRSKELTAASEGNNLTPFQAVFRDVGLPHSVRSLRDNLRWLAGWAAKGRDDRVLVVRYEDMVADPEAHFSNIHDDLFDAPMSKELVSAVQRHLGNSGEAGSLQSGDSSTRVYEKGYSGKEGVWRNYLTPEDMADYNETVQRFLDYDENAAALKALYPDLLLV